MPTKKASATWEGGLKGGKGRFETETGVCAAPYSFATRFGNDRGSSPEELLAAAHSACFSMALSATLEKAGTPPTRIHTDAACTVEPQGEGFRITKMALTVRGQVPGCDQGTFERYAQTAKEGCPVSRALLGNLEVTLDAKLE